MDKILKLRMKIFKQLKKRDMKMTWAHIGIHHEEWEIKLASAILVVYRTNGRFHCILYDGDDDSLPECSLDSNNINDAKIEALRLADKRIRNESLRLNKISNAITTAFEQAK